MKSEQGNLWRWNWILVCLAVISLGLLGGLDATVAQAAVVDDNGDVVDFGAAAKTPAASALPPIVKQQSPRVIGLDNRHGYGPDSFLGSGGKFAAFRDTLTAAGHTLIPLTSFTNVDLEPLDMVFIKQPYEKNGNGEGYSESEISALLSFSGARGGGLMVLGEGGDGSDPLVGNLNEVVENWGITYDGEATDQGGHQITDFATHPVTRGVNRIGIDYQRRISGVSAPSVDLTNVNGGPDDALAAMLGVGLGGNGVFLSDASLWMNPGAGSAYDIDFGDNRLLLINIVNFLQERVISGTVTEGGTGFVYMGVTIDLSDASGNLIESQVTGADGAYAFLVPLGFSGSVLPSAANVAFLPISRSYGLATGGILQNYPDQDFVGYPPVSISGTVVDPSGAPVQGVSLTVRDTTGTLMGTVLTDANGDYQFPVPNGWSGAVTPSLTDYEFDPPSREYTNLLLSEIDEDYTALPLINISGHILTPDGSPIANVSIGFTDADSTTLDARITDADGLYLLRVPYGSSGTVEPTLTGYTFFPEVKTYTTVAAAFPDQDYVGFAPVSITGNITNPEGQPVADAVVHLITDGLAIASHLTDASGAYTYTVPFGWSGSVQPSLTGYTFVPGSRTYQNLTANAPGQDFLGVPDLTISGRIIDPDGAALADVAIALVSDDGIVLTAVVTDANGQYSATNVPFNWSGAVTPAASGYYFVPQFITIKNISFDLPEQNFTGYPNLTIFGEVTDSDRNPIEGALITFMGEDGVLLFQTRTDGAGLYIYDQVPYRWSGSITPSAFSVFFEPRYLGVSNIVRDFEANFTTREEPVLTVPGDFITIQEAIDAAFNGVTIIVQPGLYVENINMLGKDITLTSTDPCNIHVVWNTIIDGGDRDSVVTFTGAEN
ncbi:carboxypeptidase regulatory-like domain-containing protein, partial [Candidatus Sumerlaeota bacterium]